jgi:hypothetical protein
MAGEQLDGERSGIAGSDSFDSVLVCVGSAGAGEMRR